MNPSDQIKAKLDVVDVLREYIQLKPAGVNFRANCPFHNEKSPSFIVSPEKQIWHCFGCGKGGDIFAFVMEMDGLTFVEALRLLAPKAGVELKKHNPEFDSQRNRLMDAMQLAVKYYHYILKESKQAEAARNYLAGRGLTEEAIDDWQIGYSPESWDDLVNFLKSRGFKDDEIFSAGLSSKKEGTGRFYNRFRGRIMFPIRDANANVVAFTARVSPEKEATEKMGKYINSPQTPLYDKSKILFGLDRAKNKIRSEDVAIVVEGQMDVITAHQNGFKNVVASSGTALTGDQIDLLKRYTDNLAFALDADAAGQNAIVRGEEVVQSVDYEEVMAEDARGRLQRFIDPSKSNNINIKIIEIPSGKDPDECIRTSPAEWQKAVEGAKDIMQFHFDRALKDLNPNKVEDYRRVVDYLLGKIVRLAERGKAEQDYWLKKLAQGLNASEAALREDLAKLAISKSERGGSASRSATAPAKPNRPKSREELLSEMLLSLILKFSEHLAYVINNLQIDQLVGEDNRALYKSLVIYYNNSNNDRARTDDVIGEVSTSEGAINYHDFKEWLRQEENGISQTTQGYAHAASQPTSLSALLDRLALLAEKDFFEMDGPAGKSEIIKLVVLLRKNYLQARLKEIEVLIIEAEKTGATEQINELMAEFKLLADELKEVNQINEY